MIRVLLGVDEFDRKVPIEASKAGLRINHQMLSSQFGVAVLTGTADPERLEKIRAVDNVLYIQHLRPLR